MKRAPTFSDIYQEQDYDGGWRTIYVRWIAGWEWRVWYPGKGGAAIAADIALRAVKGDE